MKWMIILVMTMTAAGPAAMSSDVEGYTLVRDDVLEALNVADRNIGACEMALAGAQEDIRAAAAGAEALKAAAMELEAQKSELQDRVRGMETGVWEDYDWALGMTAGYALGTGMCVGLAWVFNQPEFGG